MWRAAGDGRGGRAGESIEQRRKEPVEKMRRGQRWGKEKENISFMSDRGSNVFFLSFNLTVILTANSWNGIEGIVVKFQWQ